MSYKVDYHMHSYYSDGTMKPTDLVRMYKEKEYDIIALTDHDGVDGISEAVIAGEALKIKVIPGIEFSTGYDFDERELELHLLGYHIDIENQPLRERLKEIRKDRDVRNEKLLAYLNGLGYELTREDLLQRPGQTYVGKPNFARAIARKGYEIENLWEVLDTVKKDKISIFKAMELIKGAGGMSVLAHPMKTKKLAELRSDAFWDALERILRDLKKHGLKGLECFHPSATEEDSLRLVNLAGKYHLHITEGSDFHGE
ncbi:Histidinol phosphatase and related hydrolases of the PHP family [uncultured Eubacterium sp.]|nr:Histidinol phosphatase and related hydrolases of the PHP family [uncultured Eubacterium sp.]